MAESFFHRLRVSIEQKWTTKDRSSVKQSTVRSSSSTQAHEGKDAVRVRVQVGWVGDVTPSNEDVSRSSENEPVRKAPARSALTDVRIESQNESGGVNISGDNVVIHGDVVGGSKIIVRSVSATEIAADNKISKSQ